MTTQQEINALIQKLNRLDPTLRRTIKADLRAAAKPMVSAIKARTPVGTRTHSRYSNGKIVETYRPGNLKRSFRVLPLRRTKDAIIVGPQAKGGTPDGYYAHMVEFGTRHMAARPFVGPTVDSTSGATLDNAVQLLRKRLDEYEKRYFR